MPHIRHEVLIGSNVEKVYDALTTENGLAGWWTPDTKAKPEVNTTARFTFGGGYFKDMQIVELKQDESVKWKCIAATEEWKGTTLSFELKTGNKSSLMSSRYELADQILQQKSDKATLVILHHDDWKDYTPMFAECNFTWGQFLRSLKLLCETGNGRPWPHQHGIE